MDPRSTSEDELALEEFKDLIDQWLNAGDRDESVKIRSKIQKRKSRVESLLKAYSVYGYMTLAPPPAVGGLVVQRAAPLDYLFDRMHGSNVRSKVFDMLDEALGKIESGEAPIQPAAPALRAPGNSIFLVHGRDDGTKQTVARFLDTLGLVVHILHEKPNQGLTLLEKFERYGNVDFAVVLLTPDDVGRAVTSTTDSPRARQNVIFELGYFLGKLGRDKVAAIVRGDVERPSDYEGVVYIPFEGNWQGDLTRELKAAGVALKAAG